MKLFLYALVLLVVIILAIFFGYKMKERQVDHSQPQITAALISGKIKDVGDLVAAELIYGGIVKLSEGQIPFITEKGFTMKYTATVRASIDATQIGVEVTDDTVKVSLPDSEIHSIDVDPDSIEFYDNKFAVFNWTEKQDVVDAIKAAREDAEANADIGHLEEKARRNSMRIIGRILSGLVGGRTLTVE